MSTIHSNSIFHFTNMDGLIGILNSNFFPKYSKERFSDGDTNFDYWIPIVSFCDIPLSQIAEHINEYGEYGIGLNRKWVLKSQLSPVLYYNHESRFLTKYSELIASVKKTDEIQNELKFSNEETNNSFSLAKQLFMYFKLYSGYDFKIKSDKVFYNEREWRYIPEINDDGNLIISDNRKDLSEIMMKNNFEVQKKYLEFEPQDITYIVLKKEEERLAFINILRMIKGRYAFSDVEVLTSKIVTIEQINNDM